MADDVKITDLTSAGALDGTEVIPVVRDGVDYRTTAANVAGLAADAVAVVLLSANTSGANIEDTPVVVGTVNVPAKTYDYHLDAAAMFSGINTQAGNTFHASIRVEGVARGEIQQQHTQNASVDLAYVIPCIEPVFVAAGNAVVVTMTIARTTGTGQLDGSQAGKLTVKLYPA